jgi:hypothetical protein
MLALCAAINAQTAAEKRTPSSEPGRKTFTSPDRSFRFTYPDMLIRCELKAQQTGDGYYWVQPECSSYHPACGDRPTPKEPLVCIAYPRNRYSDTPALEAAVFSVSETTENEKDCLADLAPAGKTREIRGVRFYVGESADAGMNQARHSMEYVTFHNGKCYAMAITDATANAQTFDPPAREMTEQDWAEVHGRLEEARDSFQFLK